jgi:hypothetical protein
VMAPMAAVTSVRCPGRWRWRWRWRAGFAVTVEVLPRRRPRRSRKAAGIRRWLLRCDPAGLLLRLIRGPIRWRGNWVTTRRFFIGMVAEEWYCGGAVPVGG